MTHTHNTFTCGQCSAPVETTIEEYSAHKFIAVVKCTKCRRIISYPVDIASPLSSSKPADDRNLTCAQCKKYVTRLVAAKQGLVCQMCAAK